MGSPLGNAWASRPGSALGVVLWVLLVLEQNITAEPLLFSLAQAVPTRRWALRPPGERPYAPAPESPWVGKALMQF